MQHTKQRVDNSRLGYFVTFFYTDTSSCCFSYCVVLFSVIATLAEAEGNLNHIISVSGNQVSVSSVRTESIDEPGERGKEEAEFDTVVSTVHTDAQYTKKKKKESSWT